MRICNPFRARSETAIDTGPRRLSDVDTHRRDSVTHLLRPDSLSPRDLPSWARDGDPIRGANSVLVSIDRLARAGSLDEYVADTLDGNIDAWQAQWDTRADELLPDQVLTALRLGGQELENLTACMARVRELRATVAELDGEIANWRAVLRGEITHLPFPAPDTTERALETIEPVTLPGGATLGDLGRAVRWPTPIVSGEPDQQPAVQLHALTDRDETAV